MTSEKQILANQRNCKKSTGPTSQAGKEIVRFNATKHGLCSLSLLPGEDPAQVALLGEKIFEELKPVGALEEMFAKRVVMISWRLQRLSHIEMGVFIQIFSEQVLEHEFAKADRRPGVRVDGRVRFTNRELLEAEQRRTILKDVSEPQAKARIENAHANMNEDVAVLGAAYRRDVEQTNALSNLLRYETNLEKILLRNLHELQRLQAARAGQAVSPPLAIDMSVSSE